MSHRFNDLKVETDNLDYAMKVIGALVKDQVPFHYDLYATGTHIIHVDGVFKKEFTRTVQKVIAR